MSEIDNYIAQARQAGKSDEIIKQELQGAGWNESDVSRALSSGPAVSATVPAVAASAATGKIIGIIIAILVVLGAGGYFVFAKKGSPAPATQTSNTTSTPPPATQNNNSSVAAVPFHCADLLPTADYERITGKKSVDYPVKETAKSDPYGGQNISCIYAKGPDISLNFSVASLGSTTTASVALLAEKGVYENAAKQSGDTSHPFVQVSGVGSLAYSGAGSLFVASTTDKYLITFVGFDLGTIVNGVNDSKLQTFKQAALVVDANLNKY